MTRIALTLLIAATLALMVHHATRFAAGVWDGEIVMTGGR